MNLTLISAVIAAALGFGAAWTLQGRAIDSLKLEHANERIADLEALRELQIALALKNINAHYDALIRGEEPTQLGRRIFDRRNNSWDRLATRFAPVKQPSDMADVNLHLSI